ncbi:MAG TPA: bidirectional hydrogenase complex protein HoxE [Kiritimatiellia bacterium]|nr:bidirectional hydrogenase complex protein HoxE [Kiritimatiellia bacterium]
MVKSPKKIDPPSNDKRWRMVDNTMRKHGHRPDALIEALHTMQECFGYLEEPGLKYIAQSLRLPLSKVFGVATFYHFFTLKPKGRHTCVVCMGTACYIKGAQNILDEIEKKYGVKPGETTKDNELSVLTARCIGSCGLAAAVVVDGNIAGKINADDTLKQLEKVVGS